MFNKELILRGRKSAGVTLELILAITLAVLVMFFILGLVGDNLKTMVANSGFQNMFENKQKVTYGKQNFDPTQVNVQVLADQGLTLQQYLDSAIAIITKYENTPPPNQEELEKLAQAAAVAKIITMKNANGYAEQALLPKDEGTFYTRDGIIINLMKSNDFYIQISRNGDVKTLNFPVILSGKSNSTSSSVALNAADQLLAVKAVYQNKFK